MKKNFLDANVVIDFLDRSSLYHHEAKETVSIIRKHYRKPYISPTTFAISYYMFAKFIAKKDALNKIIKKVFSEFEFTTEDHTIMTSVLGSKFSDPEDVTVSYCRCIFN